jgi:hypothetical protein
MFVDLVNPQMLGCIIFMFHQVINNILNQNYILCKGLIKYSKTNTFMKIHVDSTHFRSFAKENWY